VAGEDEPRIVGRLDGVTKVVSAASRLLDRVAGFLRQLERVIGWFALIAGTISALIHPQLSPTHLLVPGTGALAVLQSAIKPRGKHPKHSSQSLAGGSAGGATHLTNALVARSTPNAPTRSASRSEPSAPTGLQEIPRKQWSICSRIVIFAARITRLCLRS
jgi:hypothetical protein